MKKLIKMVLVYVLTLIIMTSCTAPPNYKNSYVQVVDTSSQISISIDNEITFHGEIPDYYNFEDFTNLMSISSDYTRITGLKKDGTVVVTGPYEYEENDVSTWRDVIMVDNMWSDVIGLLKSGEVICTENNPNREDVYKKISKWKNIKYIDSNMDGIVAVNTDGRVLYESLLGYEFYGTVLWRNVEQAYMTMDTIVAITETGEILVESWNTSSDIYLEPYKDLENSVKLCVDSSLIVGLMEDGRVVVRSTIVDMPPNKINDLTDEDSFKHFFGLLDFTDEDKQDAYKYWQNQLSDEIKAFSNETDIIDINMQYGLLVGLKEDGSIIVAEHGSTVVSKNK